MSIKRIVFGRGASEEVVPVELIAMLNEMIRRGDINFSPDVMPYAISYEVRKSPKYWKIDRVELDKETGEIREFGRSSVGAVDFEGNVFKSASYKAVAKGIRGNIFVNNGFSAITGDGYIRYLN
ncbi:hypothetical protein BZF66_05875 [Salmonella enterica]|uniref:hypothetical protein n=1 Tax=Salmonella enterica TaxID=28901 RepID=UPI000FDFA488|nr:hypothetical protein CPT_Munch_017 [Salmonella phage Munch]EAR2661060.1 hypothetical protein [Salmonella enterica]ECV9083954.1 hypothetical protein [Salmonella enterica subsp. enterica serovar Infantis]MCP0435950.1 hypothetical protein [Salmonella enterica subsp. enterica serovar Mbandaka]WNV47127.1 hypothetical protein [Klebsiella phage fENko-Kae01]